MPRCFSTLLQPPFNDFNSTIMLQGLTGTPTACLFSLSWLFFSTLSLLGFVISNQSVPERSSNTSAATRVDIHLSRAELIAQTFSFNFNDINPCRGSSTLLQPPCSDFNVPIFCGLFMVYSVKVVHARSVAWVHCTYLHHRLLQFQG